MSHSSVHFARATGLLFDAIEELKKAIVAQKQEGTAISESNRSVAVARMHAETSSMWTNKAAIENGS